jgi:hypothetical protein
MLAFDERVSVLAADAFGRRQISSKERLFSPGFVQN